MHNKISQDAFCRKKRKEAHLPRQKKISMVAPLDQKLYGGVVLEPQASPLSLLAKCCPGRKHGTWCFVVSEMRELC